MIIDFLDDDSTFNCWSPYIFKFETNAKNFKINMEIHEKKTGYYPHFGITARQGILIMYRFKGDKNWYNFDAYAKKTNIIVNMGHLVDGTIEYDVMIYGPILSTLSKFIVEIPDQYYSKRICNYKNRKMIVAGGIQSFGIGCTTLGVTFSNILSREFDSELYKITANNDNYLDKIHDFLSGIDELPKVDVGILELDYFSQDDSNVEIYLLNIVKYLKKKCNTLICWFTIPKIKNYKKNKIYFLLKNEINSNKIIIKDLSFIHDEEHYDMCTYSHKFINDAGNILIYKELKKIIMENVEWNI